MWPVTCVWVALLLCFVLPGVANSQTFEAMFDYAGGGKNIAILWVRLTSTAILAFTLGALMAASARDLLEGGVENGVISRPYLPGILAI
jgi:hypothetical protein